MGRRKIRQHLFICLECDGAVPTAAAEGLLTTPPE